LKVEVQQDDTLTGPPTPNHVHYQVKDIAALRDWYVKTFAFKSGVRGRHQSADLPGMNLSFQPVQPQPPLGTKGRVLDHIGFDVKDLKAFIAKLEAAGVKLDTDGGYRVNDVGVGIAFITDPWGTRIELNERPKAVYLP
jgi:catechol 2,3-dioxygenase-like lactoylglutathione lyase family enzyme